VIQSSVWLHIYLANENVVDKEPSALAVAFKVEGEAIELNKHIDLIEVGVDLPPRKFLWPQLEDASTCGVANDPLVSFILCLLLDILLLKVQMCNAGTYAYFAGI
jgi:hypothetical protein